MINQAFSYVFTPISMEQERLIDQSDDQTGNTGSANEIEWIPRVGMEFVNTEEAWDFWVLYAHKIGFHARKSYNNRSILDGKTTSRAYVCAREGFRAKDKRDHLTKRPRRETRTGCQVRLVLRLNKRSEKYEVTEFISGHNHVRICDQKVTKVATVDDENSARRAQRYQSLCDKFARIAAKACVNEELYLFVVDVLDKLEKDVENLSCKRGKKTCKKQHPAQYSSESVVSSTFEKALEIPDSDVSSDALVKCKEKSGECQQYEPDDSFIDLMMGSPNEVGPFPF